MVRFHPTQQIVKVEANSNKTDYVEPDRKERDKAGYFSNLKKYFTKYLEIQKKFRIFVMLFETHR